MADDQDEVQIVADLRSTQTLTEMTVSDIEREIAVLSTALSADQVLHWLMLATLLSQRSRQIKQRVEEVGIEWIRSHGPLTAGPLLYTVGTTKNTKCVDVIRCMKLMLEACGGDVDTLCSYLSANPFKYGSCRSLLNPQQWNLVFHEQRQDKLVLKCIDSRFLRGRVSP